MTEVLSINNTPSNLEDNNTDTDTNNNTAHSGEAQVKTDTLSNPLNEKNSEDINLSNDSNVGAELANIKSNAPELEGGDEKKIVHVEILDQTRHEEYQSLTQTTSSCIFESYNEVSQGTTSTSATSTKDVHHVEEKFESKLKEEIMEQSESSASRSELFEERRENKAVEFHKTINLEDKNEDKTEKSENVATSDPPPEDKNKELCHLKLDQWDSDETKDVSSELKHELEDTNEKISSEENDEKTLERDERQITPTLCEGELSVIGPAF